jgi:hypothetical protein
LDFRTWTSELGLQTRDEERTPTRDVEGSDCRTRNEEVRRASHRRGTREKTASVGFCANVRCGEKGTGDAAV